MLLYKKILIKLIVNNISISTAESCTGGLLAYSLTKNKDCSKVFMGGYITYSNKSKIKDLNVKEETLNKFGAVSQNVAKEMVYGLYFKKKTDICIAITGIAGPGGGSKNKPVGLIYIGFRINSKNIVLKKYFNGTRIQIQKKCVNFIYNYLNDSI
jgi:nicotinamide-nucleotide amidase